ncbi:MAG: pyridoxamine 5'-phosphate oxidase family protein [Sneathiella sp.]
MVDGNGSWGSAESPFHAGEKTVQEMVGVADEMEQFARRVVRRALPKQHAEFFNQLPVLYAGYVDSDGWPWATALAGQPGFVESPDPSHLDVGVFPDQSDPLYTEIKSGKKLGLLGLEMHSRRRNRLNVTIGSVSHDAFQLNVDQSFGNCPQYIQTRSLDFVREPESGAARGTQLKFNQLNDVEKELIEASDTFFVSSFIEGDEDDRVAGVDMSHRGGRPGFVKVEGDSLTIPDYTGNFHFNTIGNFVVNPKAGLLFMDFETGDMLQLTGTVEMIWDGPELEFFQGAERAWIFKLDHGQWLKDALPLRWNFGEMSLNSLLTGSWADAEDAKSADNLRQQWRDYQVIDVVDESSVIKSFYLQPVDGKGVHPFKAGQYLTVKAKAGADEAELIRTYTVSSSPLDKSYRISVKKDGVMSSYLHEHLKVGDVLEARSPQGHFFIEPTASRPAVLLAGGVGITPMISMLRHVVQEGFRNRSLRPVTLIHSAKDSSQRAFFKEAGDLAAGSGGVVRYASLLSGVVSDEVQGTDFHGVGRINKQILEQLLPDGDCDYYLCGPANFMQSLYDLLIALGVKDQFIYAEGFGPASLERLQKEGGDTPLTPIAENAVVSFTSSGLSLNWREGDGSLLEFAESHGIAPSFGCRNGACGSCSVDVVKGEVTYPSTPSFGIEDGKALLCCARPGEGSEEVILDI